MTAPEAHATLQQVLDRSAAEQTEVRLDVSSEASTRFANNAITQNVSSRETTLTVRAVFGRRVGQASVNDFSEESLKRVVDRASEVARSSAPDTEFLPLPPAQEYPTVVAADAATRSATPGQRAEAVQAATALAADQGLTTAGSMATNSHALYLANSAGLRAGHARTRGRFVVTAMTETSSGWAQSSGFRLDQVDAAGAAKLAVAKALAGQQPQSAEPGAYPVILEPAAVAEFFGMLTGAMDAKAAAEGRSAFSGMEGKQIGTEFVTLRSQPSHPECPASPLAQDGLSAPAVTWIDRGTLRTLSYNRFWAKKSGRPFTGRSANLLFSSGDSSTEELIAGVERGILVTRFWYIRYVDPMRLLLTGMTRDGLFWIENGKISHGLRNLRFNESPLECLQRITALGRAERIMGYGGAYVPAMRVEDFRFTSGTTF